MLDGALSDLPARYNLAPTQRAGAVRLDDGEPAVHRLQWGLAQPAWAKKPLSLINARLDKVAASPVYRGAFKHRHCLVPMAGYFEWKVEDGKKQPYFLYLPDETLWAAGIWEPRADDPERAPEGSFSIITTDAVDAAAEIHDRMPVFVPADLASEWLAADAERGLALLQACPVPTFDLRRVSRRVNSPREDGPELIEAA